ncbi:MAG: hypothetical protein AAGG46_01160 [Planctomycetota bacterium]
MHRRAVFSLTIAAAIGPAAHGDTVTIASEVAGGPAYDVAGTIADFRGDVIVIERASGASKSYPADRVVKVETDWPAAYDSAKQSLAKRAWAAAAADINAAMREEQRVWARRQMVADLMRCQMGLGRMPQAGDLLVALHQSDPATPAWRIAPLPWHADDRVPQAKAAEWLADPQRPAARLLGAGWLLATAEQGSALQVLQSLTSSDAPAIRSLATAQLWRASLTQATISQVEAWRQQIAAMPAPLRSGPRHVLAQAYYRLARYDAAALVALEGPLAGAASRELSARGLLLAGRATAKGGHPSEARRLWSEVRDDYADTPQRADATNLLRQLAADRL